MEAKPNNQRQISTETVEMIQDDWKYALLFVNFIIHGLFILNILNSEFNGFQFFSYGSIEQLEWKRKQCAHFTWKEKEKNRGYGQGIIKSYIYFFVYKFLKL